MGKYLITGGAGFIGRHLARHLQEAGAEVDILDLAQGEDICESWMIPLIQLKVEQSDGVFHLAGIADVSYHETHHEETERLLRGTDRLLQHCVKTGTPIVFSSSGYVYGRIESSPVHETHPARPTTFYGLFKLMQEDLCRYYISAKGLRCSIARIFNVYGPGQERARTYSGTFISRMITALSCRPHTISLGSKPSIVRDFIYIDDAVSALVILMARARTAGPGSGPATFNVGSGRSATLGSVLQSLIEIMSPGTVYAGGVEDDAVGGEFPYVADVSRLKLNGWVPKVSLLEGLRRTALSMTTARGEAGHV